MEIDPTPRGIIFSLLGLPGGSKIQKIKKSRKFKQIQKSPSLLSAYAGDIIWACAVNMETLPEDGLDLTVTQNRDEENGFV